ncbi:hypothetical protein ACJ73_06306 [Blastomyces percursus]|uniref:Uncharacterized protein n=1 Tax=Blastomyces percursus TaxID=1658174 RepID=A0A1J9Q2N1_9EURO|nr:hypothetical protein ACJ73_06306 [Blastomyces percursus]
MPRGRPRIYDSQKERTDARNHRRRKRRKQPQAATAAATHSDPKFQHSFLIYQDNIATVTSAEPDSFTELSIALDDLLVLEQAEDDPPPVGVSSSPVEISAAEESDGPSLDEGSHYLEYEQDLGAVVDSPPVEPPARLTFPAASSQESANTQLLAQKLVEQLLQHQGCSEHVDPGSSSPDSLSLSELIEIDCPDILSQPKIQPYPVNWDHLLPAQARRRLFTGIQSVPERAGSETLSEPSSRETAPTPTRDLPPPIVDLDADTLCPIEPFTVTFDIDSAGGFASSLAVARKGLQWMGVRPPTSNLTHSLHLPPVPVEFFDSDSERWRSKQVPLHHVPHLPLGRMSGFEAVEVYLLFPRLFHPSLQHWVIAEEHWTCWIDQVFMPAIYDTLPAELIQHLVAGAKDAQTRATAASAERTTQGPDRPRVQLLHYHIPPQYLAALWDRVQFYIQQRNQTEFRGSQIIFHAKNVKTHFQDQSWQQMWDRFFTVWNGTLDRSYVLEDYYDLAKEVVPKGRSFPVQYTPQASEQPLTLAWRECCLRQFSRWLHQCAQELEHQESHHPQIAVHSPEREPARRSRRLQQQPPPIQVVIPRQETTEPRSGQGTEGQEAETDDAVHSPIDPDFTASRSQSPNSTSPPKPCWREEYYPLSLTRDMGSLTIEPHSKRTSSLRQHGLFYIQFYNISKEVFAAGSTYPYMNKGLDTLALDAGLVRSWQHIGQAMSHSPHAMLRAYIHTKVRCHTALSSCRNRSYGTREEYRVSGTLLQTIHQIMRVHLSRQDQPSVCPDAILPFFVHPTALFLDWVRWNMNRLCLGFEMVYTLQPHTLVHWEHTRVMMMFLRCLTFTYGGGGHHLQHSTGLWVDRRVRPPAEGSDVERIQEGIGIGETLQLYGFGWFLDKLDYQSMTFRPPHRASMMFNTPTLLSQYYARYRHLVAAHRDYIFFHDIFTQLSQAREDPTRAMTLLDLLVDLCLRSFRQDVFHALEQAHPKQPMSQSGLQAALAGEVPLTTTGFRRVLRRAPLETEFQYVSSMKAKVSDVSVLFTWLWGWAGDGNNGGWPRKGWEKKLYRLLFRQSFEVITQIFGLQQAREWRATLQYRFIRTHWILPYPSKQSFWSRSTAASGRDQQRKLQTWASVHPWVLSYYREHPPAHDGLAAGEINQLPVTGWQRSRNAMELTITLPTIPKDPSVPFTMAHTAAIHAPTANPHLPLPMIRVVQGPIAQGILENDPHSQYLARQLRRLDRDETRDATWLIQHLPSFSEEVASRFREHSRSMRLPFSQETTRVDVKETTGPADPQFLHLKPSPDLKQLEEDSDAENVSSRRRRSHQDQEKWFECEGWIRKHKQKFLRYQQLLREARQRVRPTDAEISQRRFLAQKEDDVRKSQLRQKAILHAMSQVSDMMCEIYKQSRM